MGSISRSSTGAMPVPFLAATPQPPDFPPAAVNLASDKCAFHSDALAVLLALSISSWVCSLDSWSSVSSAFDGFEMLVFQVSKHLAFAVSLALRPWLPHHISGRVRTAAKMEAWMAANSVSRSTAERYIMQFHARSRFRSAAHRRTKPMLLFH